MKSDKHYREHTWVDPRIEVKESFIEGKGLFARELIKKGEVLEIFGGTVFTDKDIQEDKHKEYTLLAIDDGLYLGETRDSPFPSIDQYTNHSCEPSAWLIDEVTLVARRNINTGEEISMDYATWECDEDYIYFTDCHCGSNKCRHEVSGKDWRRKELQEVYEGHFSPFIQKRIDKLEKT